MKNLISKKKLCYPVNKKLCTYLREFGRWQEQPIAYEDLLRYQNAVTHYDKNGDDTLWLTVSYDRHEQDEIEQGLLEIYSNLRSEGDRTNMRHLVVDRIDLCLYGNTKPFRIRIINTLNENFDYFYIKNVDASRVYGLELEHILSPDRIGFIVSEQTLIEEHIYGIPADLFIKKHLDKNLNEVRLAKEFVKFNERCFLRLLGDMHSANYVVDITIDFEENMYRLRAIDFDQQSYEPRKAVYLPQYFKQNNRIVDLGIKHLTWESVNQYQVEERALIHKRLANSSYRARALLEVMRDDLIAPTTNIHQLSEELSDHYRSPSFKNCSTMGQLVEASLNTLGSW